jgi:hypothetical protein
MSKIFRILEGFGDPENPDTLWDVQFLDITFSNYEHAVKFAWNHYDQTTDRVQEWKSYFSTVTTATTTAEALAEVVAEMKEALAK